MRDGRDRRILGRAANRSLDQEAERHPRDPDQREREGHPVTGRAERDPGHPAKSPRGPYSARRVDAPGRRTCSRVLEVPGELRTPPPDTGQPFRPLAGSVPSTAR